MIAVVRAKATKPDDIVVVGGRGTVYDFVGDDIYPGPAAKLLANVRESIARAGKVADVHLSPSGNFSCDGQAQCLCSDGRVKGRE